MCFAAASSSPGTALERIAPPPQSGMLGQTPALHVRVCPPGERRWWRWWGSVISRCCQPSDYVAIFSHLSLTFSEKRRIARLFPLLGDLLLFQSGCVCQMLWFKWLTCSHSRWPWLLPWHFYSSLVAGLDFKVRLRKPKQVPFLSRSKFIL